MAAAPGVSVHPGAAACLHEYAGASGRGGDRARRGAFGLRDGEVLRRHVLGAASRGELERGARRRPLGAHRLALAGRGLRRAGSRARHGNQSAGSRHAQRDRLRHRQPRRRLAVSRAHRAAARELWPAVVLWRSHAARRGDLAVDARFLPWPRAPGRALGLRLSLSGFAHAGHGRRFRPAGAPSLRALFQNHARDAFAARFQAPLPGPRGGPVLVLAIPSRRPRRRARHGAGHGSSARAHLGVPDVQLRDPASAAALRPVSAAGIAAQFTELALAVLLAPLLTGWVNQCRAWLQNKSAPGIFQPYRVLAKLFQKEVILAHNASSLFRSAPYLIFGSLALSAAIVPTLGTDLPLNEAADAIALVGLLALARLFIALAGMDVGTAFGTLGARREMMVGFLAEPALLMVFFTASLISHSTSLSAIVATIAHRELVIYPSMAFAGVAFVMVSLAENARIPIDNPATHLELTMIHEAMVLEYSGRHLALVAWASAMKLFLFLTLLANLFFPWGVPADVTPPALLLGLLALAGKLALLAIALAALETAIAKLRLFRVPELLAGSFALAVLSVSAVFLLR